MSTSPDFDHLTPDAVLDLVEGALGARCTNLCRPLNSYINRVYEVQMASGEFVIPKFYRPGRWDREALQDELDFLTDLKRDEIPVIAPLTGEAGTTLFRAEGMYFAIFPKMGGRICDEPGEQEWLELGRLLARVHVVGSARPAAHRVVLDPRDVTSSHIDYLLASEVIPAGLRSEYEDAARGMVARIAPRFDGVDRIRIHGDCHHQNIIHRPGESFYMIDFDDMAMGPPVHDMWMLLPGRVADAAYEVDVLLEGYETFRDFDRSSLALIEPLRAMRFIHFTAWCAHQAADGGFARLAPDWGTAEYWRRETHELRKQEQEIEDASGSPWMG
jgi:Ser/Thr protein kinase RdoA (MazF antagonist)